MQLIKVIVRLSKLLVTALLLVTFSTFAAADMSFGSYVVTEEVSTDSEAEFEIKVMNLGDRSLEIDITSESNDDVRIDHIDQMNLNPSIVTETTSNHDSGIEWFLLDDGRYVETEIIKIRASSSERGTKNFDITLRAGHNSPVIEDHEEDHSLEQEVAQSRTYSFEANFEGSSSSSSPETGSQPSAGAAGGERQSRLEALKAPFERFTGGDSDSESAIKVEESTEEDDSEESSEGEVSGQDTETGESETVDAVTGMFSRAQSSEKTTLVLLAGITGSIIYLVTLL